MLDWNFIQHGREINSFEEFKRQHMLDCNFIQHGRREILDLANEFGMTGFCLPGKPGIISAEGMH
jgi:hypothetical protein